MIINYHNKVKICIVVINNAKMNNIISKLKVLLIIYVWIHVKKIIMYNMVHIVVNLIAYNSVYNIITMKLMKKDNKLNLHYV